MDAVAKGLLAEGADRLGVPLDDVLLARFERYFALLVRWNARIQLTTLTGASEVVERHFLDSLAVVPRVGEARTLVDVGSGPGFPGLVIALVRPSLAVTVVESIHKKAAFLEAVKRELALDNVRVVADRMEALVDAGEQFEVAVSRATFAPGEWVARGRSLVAPGGRLIAMVVPSDEVTAERIAPGWQRWFREGDLLAPYAPGRALLVFGGRLGDEP